MIDSLDFAIKASELGASRNLSCWLYAQACHESGNGLSSLSKDYNNYFGMGYPTQRNTTASGKVMLRDNLGGYSMYYATYKDWQDSLEDRILWSKARGIWQKENSSNSIENWCSLLRSKTYFTASVESYSKGVKNHTNKCSFVGPVGNVVSTPHYYYAFALIIIMFIRYNKNS